MKKIQQILKLFIVLWSCSLINVQAAGYFSYITSITKPETRYHFVMEYWHATETYPNPCALVLPGKSRCYIQINHLHKGKDTGGVADRAPWRCRENIADLPNEKAVVDYLVNQCGLSFPYVGYSQHAGSVKTDECIGFFLTTSAGGGSGKLVPNGVCGIAPPPAGKCAFVSDNLTLSHGVLDVAQVNNHEVTRQFSFTCNTDMPVRISSAQVDHYLDLNPDRSIRSFLTLNGSPASIGTEVNAIQNQYMTVDITSKLQTFGTPSLGNFSGTTTLVLSIP